MTEELSKGFTGIEINGVRFSNIREMLVYMNKQRDHITELEKENAELKDDNKVMADNYSKMEQKFYNNLTKAKEIIKELVWVEYNDFTNGDYSNELSKVLEQAEQFLKADVGTKNYEEQDKILKTRLL